MTVEVAYWPELPSLGAFRDGCESQMRDVFHEGTKELERRFSKGEDVAHLVRARSQLVDHVLRFAWSGIMTDATDDLAFVAVGGYGRGELHPASDIDVMLLLPKGNKDRWRKKLERFVTFLWDVGLELGHSVRTIRDCVNEAKQDVTVATNLMETRLLAGDQKLFDKMRKVTSPKKIWPPKEFFAAKSKEQKNRHGRYADTAQNLEPSVKGSPGGLRDLQMIGWVLSRQFGPNNIEELLAKEFLTSTEWQDLIQGRNFLWRIRFALHLITKRREDRLLFDHQVTVAKMLDYEDTEGSLGVEQLMQDYYRTAKKVLRLNEMLLQLFQERLVLKQNAKAKSIDHEFHIKNGFLTINTASTFA
ncbi:MAG: nucleotidyltransferase domain-containing protein, partial [Pseudomonadota bacterium]